MPTQMRVYFGFWGQVLPFASPRGAAAVLADLKAALGWMAWPAGMPFLWGKKQDLTPKVAPGTQPKRGLAEWTAEVQTMGLPAAKLTLDDFITWENEQAQRHEFHRGEVFAMVGARRSHGTVVMNLGAQLLLRLKGSPCRVFSESMKVQVADDTILYPDLFVTCDREDLRTEMIFRAPLLVVEVLSPGTQAYDRSRKFALYRRLPSLREYLLIDPDTRDVQAFRRNASGEWVLHDMSDAPVLHLASIEADVAMADVFDGVEPAAGA
jgi:Uma2 family endonuclease